MAAVILISFRHTASLCNFTRRLVPRVRKLRKMSRLVIHEMLFLLRSLRQSVVRLIPKCFATISLLF